ncbi:MAG: hypothetical protein JXM73_19670 [Anaerolineae bacterium]|nr:hypothetical protein [Anaerolineae bacterium]
MRDETNLRNAGLAFSTVPGPEPVVAMDHHRDAQLAGQSVEGQQSPVVQVIHFVDGLSRDIVDRHQDGAVNAVLVQTAQDGFPASIYLPAAHLSPWQGVNMNILYFHDVLLFLTAMYVA